MGLLYLDLQRYGEAENIYEKAVKLNPKNSMAYFRLGWIYYAQGKYREAEKALKKVIELTSDDERAYGALAVLYREIGNPELAERYHDKEEELTLKSYNPITVTNYHALKRILNARKVKFVCVQYPMRSVVSLKKIFKGDDTGIIFVDNEQIFKDALKNAPYKEYFLDMFAGDFGHCTSKGNRLLAENIANVILKECFNRRTIDKQ